MIELPVYYQTSGNHLIPKIIIGCISLIILFLIFPSIDPIVFLILIMAFVIIVGIIDRSRQPDGIIYLTQTQIIIKTDNINVQLELSNIKKLEIVYSGYKGKRMVGDIIPRFNTYSGNDNYVSIDTSDEIYRFRFHVENEFQEHKIIELVKVWDALGFDISNITMNN